MRGHPSQFLPLAELSLGLANNQANCQARPGPSEKFCTWLKLNQGQTCNYVGHAAAN